MKQSPKSVFRFLIPGIAALALLAAAGCGPDKPAPSTSPVASSTPPVPTTATIPPTVPSSTPPTTTVPPTTPPPFTTTVPPTTPYTINVAAKDIVGKYLTDGRGMTLYYTVSDRPGYSNLPDETLSAWPVFYTSTVVVPASLNAADFGTYTRDRGTKQTTYKGYPLYYYFQDKAPGDVLGNKLGSVWFVVNPDSPPPQR